MWVRTWDTHLPAPSPHTFRLALLSTREVKTTRVPRAWLGLLGTKHSRLEKGGLAPSLIQKLPPSALAISGLLPFPQIREGEDPLNSVLQKHGKRPHQLTSLGGPGVGRAAGRPPPTTQRKCVSLSAPQSILGIVVKLGGGDTDNVTLWTPERARRARTELQGARLLPLADEATEAHTWPRGLQFSLFSSYCWPGSESRY